MPAPDEADVAGRMMKGRYGMGACGAVVRAGGTALPVMPCGGMGRAEEWSG